MDKPGWVTDENIDIALYDTIANAGKASLWLIKALLKGDVGDSTAGRWSVVMSCDGVSVATDGTDLWGATFDPTKLVFATSEVANSWFVLYNATAQRYIVIRCRNATASATHIAEFNICTSITGTPTTTTPGAMNFNSQWVAQYTDNTAALHRASVSRHADGDFVILLGKGGAGAPTFTFANWFPVGVEDRTDAYKPVTYVEYGTTVFTISNGYFAGYTQPNSTYGIKGKHTDGATALTFLCALFYVRATTGAASNSNHLQSGKLGGNDPSDSRPPGLAILIGNDNAPFLIKGVLPDVKWAPAGLSNGTLHPSAAAPEYAKIKDVWVPWTSPNAPVF